MTPCRGCVNPIVPHNNFHNSKSYKNLQAYQFSFDMYHERIQAISVYFFTFCIGNETRTLAAEAEVEQTDQDKYIGT